MSDKNKYRAVNRSTTRLRYHIVLDFKWNNVARVIGVDGDHVHVIVSCSPYWSPSYVVGRIKQLSTHRAWDKYGKKLSWEEKNVMVRWLFL